MLDERGPAGNRTHDLSIASPTPYRSATTQQGVWESYLSNDRNMRITVSRGHGAREMIIIMIF